MNQFQEYTNDQQHNDLQHLREEMLKMYFLSKVFD